LCSLPPVRYSGLENFFCVGRHMLWGCGECGLQGLWSGTDRKNCGDAVVIGGLCVVTNGTNDGDHRGVGASGYPDRNFAGQRLAIQLALTGEYEIRFGGE